MHDNRTQQLVYVRKGSCQVRGGDFDTLDGNKVERRYYVHIYICSVCAQEHFSPASGEALAKYLRDSDWRVVASDVDTDISSRLNMYRRYNFLFVLACLLV